MNIAQSSLKLFIGKLGAALISFLGITYFARELGATAMGVFFLFQALLGMLAIPTDFGLRGAVEKRISEGESPGQFLASAIVLKAPPILVIAIAILLFQPTINQYLGAPAAVYLALGIVIQEAAKLTIAVLKGELRVGETAVLQLAHQLTWVSVGILLVQYGYGAEALVYGLLAGFFIMLLWGWHKHSVPLDTPSITHARSLADYGRYNVVSAIGGYFYSWMDIALIGLFLTQAHVGAYETAWRVTAITVLFSSSIASTLFPQISQWDAENAHGRIESVIHETITPAVILVIPAFFGVLVFSHEIMGLVFGQEFTIASTALIILAGEKILQAVHVVLGRALQGIDHPDLAARATVISVVVNLVLNVILILSVGLVGAAIATAVSFAVNTLLHGYYLARFVEIRLPYREIIWCGVSAASMAALLYGLQVSVPITTLPRLLGAITLGAMAYGLFILLYPPLRTKTFRSVRTLTS